MKKKCPLCGKKSLVKKTGVFHFEVPDDGSNPNVKEFQVDIPNSVWDECESCNELLLSKELDKKIEQWQYTREGLLTPEEIKSIREQFGFTQVEIARQLGIGDKSYTRWENGLSIQTKAMDNLIRLFAREHGLFMETDRENGDAEITLYLKNLENLKGKNELPLAAHSSTNIYSDKTKRMFINLLKKRVA